MTVHEDAARALLEEMLADPVSAAALAETRAALRAGRYDPRYVAWIGQNPGGPQYWPDHQLAAYLWVHQALAAGRCVLFPVPVGAGPGPDADRRGNAARLARLPAPFTAELDLTQHAADSDGSFRWDAAVRGWRWTGLVLHDHGTAAPVTIATRTPPGSVPLEVGTSLPSRTLMHLTVERGVARWPYGDDRLCVLLDTAPDGTGL